MQNLWKPHIDDMELLCSNRYLEMPTNEIGWHPVEDMDTSKLNPAFLRRIRQWLFGSYLSRTILDDFQLLKYIFASCGAVQFCTLEGFVGYHWKATPDQVEEMLDFGLSTKETEQARNVGTNWLEYQCRLISGALRPMDHFYVPYDPRHHKGEWGKEVLVHRYVEHGYYEEDQKFHDHPWLVWDRSTYGVHGANTIKYSVMHWIGGL